MRERAKKPLKNRGFTLIELLVVISIIGFLATASMVAFNNARIKSRDAKRLTDMVQISKALVLYYDANNSYPAAANTQGGDWPAAFKTALAPYLKTVPKDPLLNQGSPGWRFYGFQYCDAGAPNNSCSWMNSPQTGQFCPGKYVLYSYNTEGSLGKNDCGSSASPKVISFGIEK